MDWKNASDITILDVNRVMQDFSYFTINVAEKTKGSYLDVFSSVKKEYPCTYGRILMSFSRTIYSCIPSEW